jgi:hypothetical protein
MKRGLQIKKVSADLHVLRFPAPDEHPISAECLNCSVPLSLSQPDLNSPERLLGVCENCKHWFLIDLIPDQTAGLLWRLPDSEVIRQLTFEDPPKQSTK